MLVKDQVIKPILMDHKISSTGAIPLPQNSNEVLGILTVVIKGQTKTQVEQARLQDEVAKTYNKHIGKLMWLLIDLHHHHW